MTDAKWTIHGREFTNCNCAYGCPCQFNALPTHGNCSAVVGIQIDTGHHRDTKLDGLRIAGVFAWPGPIHHGNGQAFPIVDKRADPAQRDAILRIMSGQDTKPGATMFNVFASTLTKLHDPVFTDQRGEPIINPVTGAEYRGAIVLDGGFEYTRAEMGRGWSKTEGPIKLDLADSYGQFAELHLCQDGIIH